MIRANDLKTLAQSKQKKVDMYYYNNKRSDTVTFQGQSVIINSTTQMQKQVLQLQTGSPREVTQIILYYNKFVQGQKFTRNQATALTIAVSGVIIQPKCYPSIYQSARPW